MQHFLDDDEGYFAWLDAHPQGLVVNCYRKPTPAYLVLHRAACGHIARRESRPATRTGYGKVCADDEQELRTWAARLGGELSRCGACQP